MGFFVGATVGFGVGVGRFGSPGKIDSVIGDRLSACVPVASLKPILPFQVPAGIPFIVNFQEPLVDLTTVWIGLGSIGLSELV